MCVSIKMVITLSRRRSLSSFEERKEDNLNRKELIRLVAKDNSLTLGDSEFCINAVCTLSPRSLTTEISCQYMVLVHFRRLGVSRSLTDTR